MSSDVGSWIHEHIWVPVVIAVVIGCAAVALATWLICRYRQRRRYDYTALKDDLSLPEKMELERQRNTDIIRDTALMNLQYYLRSHWQYTVKERLDDIGSRVDKHWFIVKDNKTRCDKLLTTSAKVSLMPVPFTANTQKTLAELFLILQHPYLCPITVEFGIDQNVIIASYPFCAKGSLKDVIYRSKWTDPWLMKYSVHGKGLSVKLAQTYGKQILQAMLFLIEKGLPAMSHLHSGNVIMVNGLCRLSGYENMFFGYKSRIYPLLKKKLKGKSKEALASAAFGHLLFEMVAGYEMDTAHPEPHHLISCPAPVVRVLNFIFEAPDGDYPSLEMIINHEFFHNVTLRELDLFNPAPISFSPAMKYLIKFVQKGKSLRSKPRRQSSVASKPHDGATEIGSVNAGKPPTTDSTRSAPPPPPLPPPADRPPAPPLPKSGSKSPPPTAPKPASMSTKGPSPPPPPPPAMPSTSTPAPRATSPVKPPSNIDVGKEPVASIQTGDAPKGRASLLAQIRKGANLRKVRTKDRSAPKV